MASKVAKCKKMKHSMNEKELISLQRRNILCNIGNWLGNLPILMKVICYTALALSWLLPYHYIFYMGCK